MLIKLKFLSKVLFLGIIILHISCKNNSSTESDIAVIAYYSGNANDIESYSLDQITHLIYSFLHLKGNKLAIDNSADSLTLLKLTAQKSKHENLKVLLSLGGWGGCKTCSDVFSTEKGRVEFAHSVKKLIHIYDADGIDLDWEYPAIEGFPGHPFSKEDRSNFTELIRSLRTVIGEKYIISFAAGGFEKYLSQSIEWEQVMPLLDYVNIMSYDLVHGYSTVTGHHCPLYSSQNQKESADFAIKYLESIGVPKEKMVIGAAFYTRVWENVEDINNGLFQPGKFKSFICLNRLQDKLSEKEGFQYYWDSISMAPYKYSAEKKQFATFDDSASVALKTKYAIDHKLGGIMFWELVCDHYQKGLLNVIEQTRNQFR